MVASYPLIEGTLAGWPWALFLLFTLSPPTLLNVSMKDFTHADSDAFSLSRGSGY